MTTIYLYLLWFGCILCWFDNAVAWLHLEWSLSLGANCGHAPGKQSPLHPPVPYKCLVFAREVDHKPWFLLTIISYFIIITYILYRCEAKYDLLQLLCPEDFLRHVPFGTTASSVHSELLGRHMFIKYPTQTTFQDPSLVQHYCVAKLCWWNKFDITAARELSQVPTVIQ